MITYYARGGLIQGNSSALGPDDYHQYSLLAKKKKYKLEEADLTTMVVPSGSLVFEIWQEWIDAATPLFSAPSPMREPQIEDYLVDSTGAGWTVLKVNHRQLFDVVYVLEVGNRN